MRVYPQLSPRGVDVRVNWFGGMSFYGLATTWHVVVQGDADTKRTLLADRRVACPGAGRVGCHPAHHVPAPASGTGPTGLGARCHPRRVGRADAGGSHRRARGGHPSDVLADWVLENDLEPGVVGVDVTNADPDGVAAMLLHPAGIISNSDAGAHLQMMCATGDTTLLLTRHVRERGDFSLEDAVWQLTGRQASLFGFDGLGVLAPGRRRRSRGVRPRRAPLGHGGVRARPSRRRSPVPSTRRRFPLHRRGRRGGARRRHGHRCPARATAPRLRSHLTRRALVNEAPSPAGRGHRPRH